MISGANKNIKKLIKSKNELTNKLKIKKIKKIDTIKNDLFRQLILEKMGSTKLAKKKTEQ